MAGKPKAKKTTRTTTRGKAKTMKTAAKRKR